MHTRLPIILALLCVILNIASVSAEDSAIGLVLPLTGPASFFGTELRNGMEVCNQKGLVNLVFEDSESLPAKGVSAFNKLFNSDKPELVVIALSSVASAVIPIAKRREIPLLLTLVSATGVASKGGDSVFRYFTSGEQEAPIMAKFARANDVKTAAIIYIEDEYGESYQEAFSHAFTLANGEIVSSQSFQRSDTDFKTILTKLKASAPDGIYIIGFDKHILNIVTQARQLGIKSKLMSNWILASPEVRKKNSELLEGILITTPEYYYSDSSRISSFRKSYELRFHQTPSAYAAIGCDIVAIARKSKLQPKKSIIANLRSVKNYAGVLGILNSSEDGEITVSLAPAKIRAGKLQVKNQ